MSSVPALFAKLFIVGTTWTFAGRATHGEKGKVTCRVAKAGPIKGGWSMDLACRGMSLADHLDGTYVATAEGLWRKDTTEMLIAAKPVAGGHETRTHDVIDIIENYQVDKRDGAWCFSYERSAGDGDGFTLCITEKRGLVGGSASFSGGTDRDLYFGMLVP